MPQVLTPNGRVITDPNLLTPGALRYYEREPGYTVLADEAQPVTVEQDDADTGQGDDMTPPAKSASKAEWFEYAQGVGLDVPDDDADITKDELVALVEKAQSQSE